jgi:hypothetical protein
VGKRVSLNHLERGCGGDGLEESLPKIPSFQESLKYSVLGSGILVTMVVFCTGGAGTICSAQVRALVHLGANACIIGRNVRRELTEDPILPGVTQVFCLGQRHSGYYVHPWITLR